ncbi:MAG: phosphodiester glycosidase family protein, partial [Paludibacteraceae bacterium]|nr:phosphodiester glycosidase family protein [Paludibacteraceae bacterium]
MHCALCINLCAVDNILLNGVSFSVDTTAVYPIGPSTKYIAMTFTRADGKVLHVYQTLVDRTNKYISFEAAVGRDSILGGECISTVAKRHSTEGRHVFAGHNGDFYVTQGDVGLPTGACVCDNQLAYTPNNSRPVAAYAEDGTPFAGQFRFNGSATHNGNTLKINHVNYNRLENQLVLYNDLQGKYTRVNEHGVEVVVALAEGETWGMNREIKVVATEYRYHQIGAAIPQNGAVLSGHGTMATALESIAVGDTITLALNTTMDDAPVAIANCVGGDPRALMLKDGKVETNEIWDELHPRTGWGFSQTGDSVIYCIVDGRGTSMGCNTKVLAEIMQSAGAYTAINLDGGGSSSMYIDPFGPMNTCSDGYERSVSNGMFVVNNAPADNVVTAISANIGHIKLPLYGTYRPVVYGYNQYGALINTDVTDFELSCDATIGHIEDGQFVASGKEDGLLQISYNGATTYVRIIKNNDAKIAIRLDSVLIDAKREYPIEVQSIIGVNTQFIQPKALTWTVDNPEICNVQDGILTGLVNGETFVVGQLGEEKDTLKVIVEIPEGPSYVIDLNETTIASWEVKSSSNKKWETTLVSATTEDNAKITFTYSAMRQP